MSLKPDFQMTPHGALEGYFLGAARLVLNDQEIKLSFKKVLALMAYLALEGSTPRSKLVALLWSDLDEDSARRNLRRELHRLKTKTPQLEGRCESVGDDLRLREPFSSDAQIFLNAVARDDPETALELYKGVLLEGLELSGASGFHEWLELKREFFGRQHKKAMLDFAERLETRGDWRRALELHLQLLEQDELQERQHREIMRLYYLLGEREAALEQFERFKIILNTELKLEPLPETLELARQIRAAQTLMPQTQTRVSSQALLLPRTAPLVGRLDAWARMEAAWNAGQLIFVSGEPGVGKTRLLLEFAASKGAFHQNTGRPGDVIAPYSTAIRTISDLLEAHPTLKLPVWVKCELSRLLPTLSSEPPPLIGSLEERLRFFNAFVELVMLVLRDVPILISDDMQFFDAASLELAALFGNWRQTLDCRLQARRFASRHPKHDRTIRRQRSGCADRTRAARGKRCARVGTWSFWRGGCNAFFQTPSPCHGRQPVFCARDHPKFIRD
jgi:DNA-binding SARP family transcriptional activator